MKRKADLFGRALSTGVGLQKQEQAVATVLASAQEHRISVGEIRPRHNPATRALDPGHVLELAESIAALGLIEPVAVDTKYRLLAGGHRCAALRLVAATPEQRASLWRELFHVEPSLRMLERIRELPSLLAPVPVHVVSIDSELDPGTALGIEIAENAQRRDYTRNEIRALATTLKAAGYRDGVGRPKQGEKTVIPALAAVLGKSKRTVYMMLASADCEVGATVVEYKAPSGASEDKRLKSALMRWLDKRVSTPKGRAMAEALLKYLGSTCDAGGGREVVLPGN